MRFTEEELRIAKSVDLCAVASHLGYTVRRIGKYHTLKEMDSIRIYNRTHWFRWSRRYEKGENGGSQIDFLRVFAGMDVKEAVFWLLDFTGYKRLESKETLHGVILPNGIAAEERKEFVLPEYAGSNAYLYDYLVNQRGIAKAVVDHFVKAGILMKQRIITMWYLWGRMQAVLRSLPVCGECLTGMERALSVMWRATTNSMDFIYTGRLVLRSWCLKRRLIF